MIITDREFESRKNRYRIKIDEDQYAVQRMRPPQEGKEERWDNLYYYTELAHAVRKTKFLCILDDNDSMDLSEYLELLES